MKLAYREALNAYTELGQIEDRLRKVRLELSEALSHSNHLSKSLGGEFTKLDKELSGLSLRADQLRVSMAQKMLKLSTQAGL